MSPAPCATNFQSHQSAFTIKHGEQEGSHLLGQQDWAWSWLGSPGRVGEWQPGLLEGALKEGGQAVNSSGRGCWGGGLGGCLDGDQAVE